MGCRPIFLRIVLITPVSSSSVIHEYVVMRKFIQSGNIVRRMNTFCQRSRIREKIYASGYAIIRQINVAMTAKVKEFKNITIYFSLNIDFMLSRVKFPSESVNE
jgi:hypothetical protein